MMTMLLRTRDWHYKENSNTKWNFTKFLADRQGNVVDRFEPTDSLKDLEKEIQNYLAA
jgi:glutathione peroxidase